MIVCIVTITELENFGNKLQNFALQEELKELGVQVDTAPNLINYEYRRKKSFVIKQIIAGVLHKNLRWRIAVLKKKHEFSKFDSRYLTFSQFASTLSHIPSDLDEYYDLFIAGSDQIWNPYFTFNFDFNFLTFAKQDKRIAYAASFGVEKIPDKMRSAFRTYLNGLKCISVREYAGQNIVKELTGNQCKVLLDPTLLRTSEQWLQMERKPRWIKGNERFVLLYCLGDDTLKSEPLKRILLSQQYSDCKMVDINDMNDWRKYTIAPDHFIWLIHHAQLIITDSFHATVFSILFEKSFFYAQRKDENTSMSSRVSSLKSLLDFPFPDNEIIHPTQQDIARVQMALKRRKKEAIQYLKDALEIHE